LAFELGISRGRGIIDVFDGNRLRLEDAGRFTNSPKLLEEKGNFASAN